MANLSQCKECGCVCVKCLDHDVHLHAEIESLKRQLKEKDNHIVTMETNFLNEANKYPNGELLALHEELLTWQDKYKRLYDAHRRVQRVNQGLEDKLLRLVDVTETDKNTLTKDVATLSHKLAEANYAIKKLTDDNERYKNDVSLAIQFLQCKPGNFVAQKFDSLPNEVQAKVSTYMGTKRKSEEKKTPPEIKSIKVPIPTFPPTAMVYSVPKTQTAHHHEEKDVESAVNIVSAAIMAKVLEERERERSCVKHCDTCTCSNQIKIVHDTTHHSIATQTTSPASGGDDMGSLCLQCNGRLDRERASLAIIKSVSSVEQCKNKAMPVYIHDHNNDSSSAAAGVNVAKVQPNNFLNDTGGGGGGGGDKARVGATKLRVIKQRPNDEAETHDLIDLGASPAAVAANEIYFANEKNARSAYSHAQPIRTHHTLCQPAQRHAVDSTHNRNALFDHSANAHRTMPVLVPSSLSSDEHSEPTTTTCSEPTTNSRRRVEEWMAHSVLTPTPTDCSESLVSSTHNDESASMSMQNAHEIDTTKYREIEDHVKKFLFGEYTILSEIKKSEYD